MNNTQDRVHRPESESSISRNEQFCDSGQCLSLISLWERFLWKCVSHNLLNTFTKCSYGNITSIKYKECEHSLRAGSCFTAESTRHAKCPKRQLTIKEARILVLNWIFYCYLFKQLFCLSS